MPESGDQDGKLVLSILMSFGAGGVIGLITGLYHGQDFGMAMGFASGILIGTLTALYLFRKELGL